MAISLTHAYTVPVTEPWQTLVNIMLQRIEQSKKKEDHLHIYGKYNSTGILPWKDGNLQNSVIWKIYCYSIIVKIAYRY